MNVCVAFDRDLDLVVILRLLFEKNQLELIACDSRASKKWESKRASVPFHIRCIRKDGDCELGGYNISTSSPYLITLKFELLLLLLLLLLSKFNSLWQLYGRIKFYISTEIYISSWSFSLCASNGTKIRKIREEMRKLS
jgi:hypothetical protein